VEDVVPHNLREYSEVLERAYPYPLSFDINNGQNQGQGAKNGWKRTMSGILATALFCNMAFVRLTACSETTLPSFDVFDPAS
jgi:hypothetical protein